MNPRPHKGRKLSTSKFIIFITIVNLKIGQSKPSELKKLLNFPLISFEFLSQVFALESVEKYKIPRLYTNSILF